MKPLTKQERYILFYASFQQPNKDIAEAMGLQVNTVKVHKHNLYKKLGLTGMTKEAARESLNAFVDNFPDLFDGLFTGMEDEAENLNEETKEQYRELLDRRYDEEDQVTFIDGEEARSQLKACRKELETWTNEGGSNADLAG